MLYLNRSKFAVRWVGRHSRGSSLPVRVGLSGTVPDGPGRLPPRHRLQEPDMRPVPSAPAVPLSSRPLLRLACLLALSSVPVLLQAAPAALEREVNTFIGSKDDGNGLHCRYCPGSCRQS